MTSYSIACGCCQVTFREMKLEELKMRNWFVQILNVMPGWKTGHEMERVEGEGMTEVVEKQDVWLEEQTLTCPDTLMGLHVLPHTG